MYCVYDCILCRVPIKIDSAKKMCYLTHPPDPLPPTIGVQWCVLLSRSAIGVVGVVIAARIVAAAAVAPLSPAALPDRRLLRRRRRRSSPPC